MPGPGLVLVPGLGVVVAAGDDADTGAFGGEM